MTGSGRNALRALNCLSATRSAGPVSALLHLLWCSPLLERGLRVAAQQTGPPAAAWVSALPPGRAAPRRPGWGCGPVGLRPAPSWSRPQRREGPSHPPPGRDRAGAELPPQRHGHRHDDQDRRPQVALPPVHQDAPQGEPPAGAALLGGLQGLPRLAGPWGGRALPQLTRPLPADVAAHGQPVPRAPADAVGRV